MFILFSKCERLCQQTVDNKDIFFEHEENSRYENVKNIV